MSNLEHILYTSDLINKLVNQIWDNSSNFSVIEKPSKLSMIDKRIATMPEIPISRVIFSGDVTTVYFTDGTKTSVKCSENDHYDRETAIVYALIKRIFGKLGRYDSKKKKVIENEVDGNGLSVKLEKIVKSGYDQDVERANYKSKKAAAQAAHKAKQKAEHEAAWKRRVAKRAEQMKLDREALALLDSLNKTKQPLNETANANAKMTHSKPDSTDKTEDAYVYIRPNKPFSKFTAEEKRAYWREQNRKRKAF